MNSCCARLFLVGILGIAVLVVQQFLSLPAYATDYTSPNFILRDPVISVGGTRSTSPSFELLSSIGQTVIGEITSTGFIERSGFLYFPADGQPPSPPPPAPPGGVGGISVEPSPITSVTFSGKAYPSSKVSVLKDGQLAVSTIAGPDANFEVTVSGLSTGGYTFLLYGEDSHGRRSSSFIFPLFLTRGTSTRISGIFLTPTIDVDKLEVKRGDNLAILGQTVPDAEVVISVQSTEEIFVNAKAQSDGAYLYNLDTSPLEVGGHAAKSKASAEGIISSFGKSIGFRVGAKSVTKEPAGIPEKGDLNGDARVNLIDFSILAYWYKRPLSPEFAEIERKWLFGDGEINLRDFSIMAFYWTG